MKQPIKTEHNAPFFDLNRFSSNAGRVRTRGALLGLI